MGARPPHFLNRATVLGLAFVACQTPPAAPPPPPLGVPWGLEQSSRLQPGTLLGGVLRDAEGVPTSDTGAVGLRAQLVLVEGEPAPLPAPLAGRTQLVASLERPTPLSAISHLASHATLGRGASVAELRTRLADGEAGRIRPLNAHHVALLPGAVATFTTRADAPVRDPGNYLREYTDRPDALRAIELLAEADGESARLALRFSGLVANPPADEDAGAASTTPRFRPGSPEPRTELLPLTDGLAPGERIAIQLDSPFTDDHGDQHEARTCILFIEVDDGPPDPELVALARADLERETDAEHDRVVHEGNAVLEVALEAIAPERPTLDLRTSLVYLCDATEARLGVDVALTAHAEELAALARGVLVARDALAPDGARAVQRDQVGWWIERATWTQLAKAASEGHQSPEHQGLMLRHAGEAGRSPGALMDHALAARDADDFAARLVDENRIALEDPSPAARRRAFEWLTQRDAAPAGFDPFAPVDERRGALEQAAATGGGQ